MKDQRTKWIKNQLEMKVFNDLVKMMLEEDEYKRDDFMTLTIKSKLKNDL
jgi:protein associated with RNAse G/E